MSNCRKIQDIQIEAEKIIKDNSLNPDEKKRILQKIRKELVKIILDKNTPKKCVNSSNYIQTELMKISLN